MSAWVFGMNVLWGNWINKISEKESFVYNYEACLVNLFSNWNKNSRNIESNKQFPHSISSLSISSLSISSYDFIIRFHHTISSYIRSHRTRVVYGLLFLDPTRPGETLTRPAIADKRSDPTLPAARPLPHMCNLQLNNYLLISLLFYIK